MSDNEVRNSVTVSVKIKKPTVQYGSIEVMASCTMALPDTTTLADIPEYEAELWDKLLQGAETQAQVMRDNQLNEAPPMPPAAPEQTAPAPRVPTTAKPVNPPAAKTQGAASPDGWTRWGGKFPAPKADERKVGLYWPLQVIGYNRGEHIAKPSAEKPNPQPYHALKIWVKNGKFTNEVNVFHDHPAYPPEGTPMYEWFKKDVQVDTSEDHLFCIFGCTGKERGGVLDVIPLAFTSKPDATPVLPSLTSGGDEYGQAYDTDGAGQPF